MIRLTVRIVIGCLLAAAIWWVGPLLMIGVYRPLGSTLLRQTLVALVLLWALWPVLVRIWSRLSMSTWRARPKPRAPTPDTLDPLSRRLKDLDAYLAQVWLKNKSGWRSRWKLRKIAPHRYVNPWFLVIGASGSGKTTMIRRGGLALRGSADLLGRSGVEEGHTVDCNFWRAGDAIWFDTNGHWVEPGGGGASPDLAEWTALLSGLKRTKRTPALDGVVLCVDCDWLIRASAANRKRAADAMRARLSEMSELLALRVPIYLAATNLDKVPGALSFVGGLDDATLAHGIGFGFPATAGKAADAAPEAAFEAAMLDLEKRIQEQVLYMAPSATDTKSNVERLHFVESLSRLRRYLADFLQRSVVDASMASACQLRGIWMGSSVDLIDGVAPTILEMDDAELAEHGARPLSVMWGAVLRQTIGERGLAAVSNPVTARNRAWRMARWALGIGVVGVATSALLFGYMLERNHLERVWARFTEGKRLAERQSADSKPAAALIDVMTQMRYIDDNMQSANEIVVAPYWEHARVARVTQETYRKHLRKTLMPELYNYVSSSLVAQLSGAPGDIYETLKIYLMLARPEHRDPEKLVLWMSTEWPKLAAEGHTEEDRQEYEAHLRAVFTVKGVPHTPEDKALVQEARAKAALLPSIVRVITRIKSQGLPARIEDVSLATAGGYMAATTLRMRGDLSPTDAAIPGWYTRAGYQDVFKPKLREAALAVLTEESWVLRDQRLTGNSFEIDKAVEKLADATRSQFLQEYIKRWQTFLNDVTVRPYSGMSDAAQIASSFIDPQSPLAQLIRFAGRETTLTGNYEGDVDSWIDKQKYNIEKSRRAIVGEVSGERARFKLLPEHVVEDHFEAIRRLGVQLNQASTTGNGSSPLTRLFEPVYRQLSLVNGAMMAGQILPEYDAFARLRAEAGRQPEPMRGIVLDLVNSGSSAGASGSRAIISRNAAGASRVFCNQGLSARYPLKRTASADVGVQDYEGLFGPQGSLATHFKEQLAAYVDTSASPWRAKRADGDQTLVNPDVLRAYESASLIRAGTLDEQGHLRVSTMLRVVDMDPQIGEVLIDLAGTTVRYAHGSVANKRVDWTAKPSANGQLSVRITTKTIDSRTDTKQFDGPWALFRFFDSGRQEGSDADRRETVHQTALGTVRLEWQALTTPAPLWSNVLQSFSCPR